MKKQFVYDPLISKRQQYLLATQVTSSPGLQVHISSELFPLQLVRAVLKIGELKLLRFYSLVLIVFRWQMM
jgi:hypothetical protein